MCTHYWLLQCFSTYFHKLKEIGVLLPIFPDYVISRDYGKNLFNAKVFTQIFRLLLELFIMTVYSHKKESLKTLVGMINKLLLKN